MFYPSPLARIAFIIFAFTAGVTSGMLFGFFGLDVAAGPDPLWAGSVMAGLTWLAFRMNEPRPPRSP